MIFTALSPNTQQDDFRLALKVLFSPSQYLHGKFPKRIGRWFKNFFGVKYAATYESARTALLFVLKELGVKDGDEVIIQSFTCIAAVNPIKWAGAVPVFVDINPKIFNMDFDDLANKVTEKTKVILVQHTFGYPALIEEIVDFAKSKGIFVIEDCAHTIGTELGERKLGTFGDAAIYSLGRDKAISASFGGVVITSNDEVGRSLEEGQKFLTYPSKSWVIRQVLYTIIAYLTRELYDKASLGKLIHLFFSKVGVIQKATSEGEKKEGKLPKHARSCLPNALARVAFNQLHKIEEVNNKKREIMHIYVKRLEKLSLDEVDLPEWKEGKNFFPIRFPLLVKRRDKLVEFSKEKGILLGDWYDTPIAPKDIDLVKSGYKQGSCPNAEDVCENIVNLPLHVNMTEEDALKVIAVIRDFYK